MFIIYNYRSVDIDKILNENIEKARVKLCNMALEYGFEAGKTHWEWDPEKPDVNKGIDDMLLGKMKENI